MMTTSLTRRDRRVIGVGRERGPEAEAEPEALTSRSSHSSKSSGSSGSRRSKSSADSQAEEVAAQLSAVNERLAKLGRK